MLLHVSDLLCHIEGLLLNLCLHCEAELLEAISDVHWLFLLHIQILDKIVVLQEKVIQEESSVFLVLFMIR